MPKATKVKANVSRLSDFADIIRQQGEEKRKEDLRITKKTKEDLPSNIRKLRRRGDEELLTLYDDALRGGYSNPKLMEVLDEWKAAIRREILRRMEG